MGATDQKEKRSGKEGKNQGKGKTSGVNVRFSTLEMALREMRRFLPIRRGVGRNAVNFADREVLISRTVLGRAEWGRKSRGGRWGWGGGRIVTIVLVSPIPVVTAAHCVVLTRCVDTKLT